MAAPPLVYSRFKAPEAANGTLDVFEAGSLQNRKTTYSSPNLTGANSNPVSLNSLGEADVFYTGLAQLVLKDSDGDTIWTKDNIGLAGETTSQWINSLAATYSSSTQFTLSGDQTTEYHVGRRVRLTGSSTLYGTISASSYSNPSTTVTVTLDSGSLDANLASAATGINSATNGSISVACIEDLTATAAELNKTDDSAAAVTGFVSGMRVYLDVGGAASPFDVAANVTESTFESVGPTSSGATNTWAALDSAPSTAIIAIILITMDLTPSGTDSVPAMHIYARQTGQASAVGGATRVAQFLPLVDDYIANPTGTSAFVFVPLDSSRRFDITWSCTGESARNISITLKGFYT